jgi:hypothetical protein
MENKILKESKIISILNSKYYFIKLNAEYKYPIIFNNKKYFYKPNGLNTGYHELAYLLADYNSKIIFPTLCFLNSENEIIYRYNQYTTSKQLYNILYNLIL